MVKPSDLIDQLSELLGVEKSEIRTVDNALVRSGLRVKAQGRYPVNVTLIEMLRLLLGIMGASNLTQAGDSVKNIERFRLLKNACRTESGSLNSVEKYIGLSIDEMNSMKLIDVLMDVVRHLVKNAPSERSALWGGPIWLEVIFGGPVAIRIMGEEFSGIIQFVGKKNTIRGDLSRQSRVSQETLIWIGRNAEDE